MTAAVAFEARAVESRRDGRSVLRIPAFEIAAGEALAILGPNGAGKSTLLSLLAGLAAPDRGTVCIGGVPATGLAARRRVSLLPQDAPMLAGSVLANVARPLRLRKVGRDDARRRAAVMLERVGLSTFADRDARALSGGEARRVALARALVTEPDALLLDEPFSGMDDSSRERLLADVRSDLRESGRTLVMVTQSRDEAVRLGSRLAVLWQSEIRQAGAPEEVLARPATPEIARFVGAQNVLRATVVGATADGILADSHGIRFQAAVAEPFPALGSVVYLIFGPEHVEVRSSASTSGSPRNVLRARVVSVAPREGRVEIALDAGVPIAAAVTRSAVEQLGLAAGLEVLAVIKATAIHVLQA